MKGQITFEEYIKSLNEKYAKNCRHQKMDHCYMQIPLKSISEVQCPCEYYEIKEKCTGCVHDNPKRYNVECFHCKRYNFMPTVNTKNIEDKWEKKME